MLWVFVAQMVLVVVLFAYSDIFPSWVNRVIVLSVFFFPLLAYLTVLARPSIRHAWHDLILDSWSFIVCVVRAIGNLFRPATAMKLVYFVGSLKRIPATIDEWITLCILPFKTCVVTTFPLIWIFEKILAHTTYYQPYRRSFGLSYQLLFECYLISLLALLFGAVIQGLFCKPGRVTTTLRFFLVGLVLLFFMGLGFLAS
jgi:hypothetical protein